MRVTSMPFVRRASVAGLGFFAFGLLLLLPSHQLVVAGATDGRTVIRVEEDWRLVLNEPGADVDAPQFHTVMSPTASTDEFCAQASWNYRELPDFAPGGMQMQAWAGEDSVDDLSFGEESLSSNAETITWTQRLECTASGPVRFTIVYGRSQTWGSFGGAGTSILIDPGVPSLDQYSTLVSKQNSCVTYGANRVNSLTITQVRRYYSDGTMHADTTPVVVFGTQSQAE